MIYKVNNYLYHFDLFTGNKKAPEKGLGMNISCCID